MTLLPPTAAQQKRIDKELPPDPEMRKQDIRALREWLSKQPHLPDRMGSFGMHCYHQK
jgi:dienelactone hydrolase